MAHYSEDIKTLTDLTGLCWWWTGFIPYPPIKLDTLIDLISYATGMDIDEIDGSDHRAVKDYEQTAASIQEMIYHGKPTICALNGKAMGDGVAYALCSDYLIAVKDCFFMMPEIR